MALAVGVCLGPYEILAPLGAGGMGEVYRAHDTRLDRAVAIKVLPAEFAQDADRLKRFEQEARATSALNHPNILTVHDIGTHEGAPYIVAELLDGEELRAQLNIGALPVRTAIDYAQQITAGLAAAHDKGITHRDLKPENLFVTKDGLVKILDFGLARMKPQKFGDGVDLEAPTLKPLTSPGVILGTVGYMSPEQVRGQESDHRSDIFSFGMILYEMLSGRRAFTGASVVDVISAITRDEPPELSETNAKVSPQLERLVRHCLEKKPELRFQSARDLGFALEALSSLGNARALAGQSWTGETSVPTDASPSQHAGARAFPGGRVRLAWLVAAVLLLSTLSFALAYFRRAPAENRATFTYLPLPEKTTPALGGGSAISPDGRRVVMSVASEGTSGLWLYSFEQPGTVLLAGTEGAAFPFWSPDSRSIGFFTQGKLKRIEAAGGMPATLCDAPTGFGGAWSSTGVILFAPANFGQGLYRVAESGGTPIPVTTLDAARLEIAHNFPSFLPDGRHFIFFALGGQPEYRGIRLGSLDQPQSSFLLPTETNAAYTETGYLLFVRGRKILAAPFDADKLSLSGDPVPVTEQVYCELTNRYADLLVAGDKLLYSSGGNLNHQLVWLDRNGRQLLTVGPASEYRSLALSSDGSQVILERNDPLVEFSDLWQGDLRRATFTRLTSNPTHEFFPLWSADGSRVAFTSYREGFGTIWQKGVSGDDKEERLLKEDARQLFISDWSRDGKFIV